MADENESIKFTFSWRALNLLGKSLYSNAWNAISELVANGFDAGANNVYVLIDARNKHNSIVEIMDDGSGMVEKDLHTYAKVGFDKRDDFYNNSSTVKSPSNIMGRKGIGKLAALFLSNDYFLQTKKSDTVSTWNLSLRDSEDLDETPYLKRSPNDCISSRITRWKHTEHGTLLTMNHVDLRGLGTAAFDSLSAKLANQFLLSSLHGKAIYLCVMIDGENDTPEFKKVEKSVAFKNFAYIATHYISENSIPSDISTIKTLRSTVRLPYTNIKDEKFTHRIEVGSLSELADKNHPTEKFYPIDIENIDPKKLAMRNDVVYSDDGKQVSIPYALTGWIAFHSTINNQDAQINDDRFIKNRFYNPAQIRLYVRNKLAAENLLDKLGITQAFVNYIEGEVSFDLLDDDLLPDIATSSRQGFDELDERWGILQETLRPIVTNLIRKRGALSKKVSESEEALISKEETTAKNEALSNLKSEIEKIPSLKSREKDMLSKVYAAQLKGDVGAKAKTKYVVFLSHQSKDKLFTDFIYNLLKHRGACKSDFFYTSADDGEEKYGKIEPLEAQIRRNITDDNTLIAYFTSPNFRKSEFCLFEAGAGWATRSVGEYELLSTRFKDIPDYLTNSKPEKCLKTGSEIRLDKATYSMMVVFLNCLIEHINKGRRIAGLQEISLFDKPYFPDKVELTRTEKNDEDFMDPDIVDYWNAYIRPGLKQYEAILKEKGDDANESKRTE